MLGAGASPKPSHGVPCLYLPAPPAPWAGFLGCLSTPKAERPRQVEAGRHRCLRAAVPRTRGVQRFGLLPGITAASG